MPGRLFLDRPGRANTCSSVRNMRQNVNSVKIIYFSLYELND